MYTRISSSPATAQADRSPISVRRGLRDDERPIAARIYFDAFRRKLTPLLGAAATALPILERSLDDVVDTNPGARRLYERSGFAPIITRSYPFLRPFGFTEVTTMRQSIR